MVTIIVKDINIDNLDTCNTKQLKKELRKIINEVIDHSIIVSNKNEKYIEIDGFTKYDF